MFDDQNNNKITDNNDFHYDNDVDDDLQMLEISWYYVTLQIIYLHAFTK